MEHLELVTQFCNIGRTHRWDLLKNLLAEGFYFESGLRYIEGAQNYIDFEQRCTLVSTFETLFLFSSKNGEEYYHIYELTTYNPIYFTAEYHETIGVKNDLIQYSILTADSEEFPEVILNRLKESL